MKKELRALAIIESESDIAELAQTVNKNGHCLRFENATSFENLDQLLRLEEWDLAFIEYPHTKFDGTSAFDLVKTRAPKIPVFAISNHADAETVVELMRKGAKDYFFKQKYSPIIPAIERELSSDVSPREDGGEISSLASAAEYENIVENVPVAIAIFNDEGIRYINKSGLELIGAASMDEVLGKPHLEFIHPDDKKIAKRRTKQAWEKKLPPLEERLLRLDGGVIDAEFITGPIIYEGKKAIVTSFMDISDRIRNRRESDRRLFQIQVAAEIARDATAAGGVDELLDRAVTLIHERFGYYHAAIFLIDDKKEYAVIKASRGEAGQKMLDMGHKLKVGKVGIVGYVAGTGEPRIALDVGVDAAHFKQPLLPKTRSEMAIPLKVENRVIGVLDVQSLEEAAFHDQDIQVLSTMADQLAVAIDKARLLAEVNRRADELKGLYDAALATSSELDPSLLLRRLYEQVQKLIAPDTFLVAWVEPEQERIDIVLAMEGGEPLDSLMGKQFPISKGGLSGWVVKNKKTLLCDDLIEDTLPVRPIHDPESIATTRSWLGVPLIIHDRVLGVASIQSFQPRAFDEGQKNFFETLSAQAVIALENARLFETVQKRALEFETLRQVSLKLTASLEPQYVFDAILDGVFELVPGLRAAHIFTLVDDQLRFGSALFDDGSRGQAFSTPRENGLTYQVARMGETIVVSDMQNHPIYEDVPESWGWTGSIIGVPLKISDRVVGVMNISFHEPRKFSDDELRIYHLLGDQAAFAIENANLFEQTNIERRSISLLFDIGRSLSQSLNPEKIFEQAVIQTCHAMGGTRAIAFLLNEQNNALIPIAVYDAEKDVLIEDETKLEVCIGLAGWVAKERQADVISDIREDDRWESIPEMDGNALSAISAPIINDLKTIGTLSVYHENVNAFSKDQLNLMEAICQQVSLAYSNATRYQEINRLVDRLAAQQYRLESLIRELPIGLLLFDDENRLANTNILGQDYISALLEIDVGDQISNIGSFTIAELLEHQGDLLPIEVMSDENPPRRFELQARSVAGGDTYEWLLAIRDVTREREIQERVQMQDRLATVGQLAAGIAHDFNNIMAAIVIYADLLKTDTGLSPASFERLTVIQRQVQRASSLIRQILDFSRKSVMEQIELDLLPYLKEIEKLLRRMLPETIQTRLNYDEGDYKVFVDPTRLQQVLMNLAVNARDAMPGGGSIQFELENLQIGEFDEMPATYLSPGDWVRLSIIDTGIGIPPENLQRVFEPFFTTKDVGKGTGLGLSQVYGIVKQHGGYIDIDSKVGEGTTFHIFFPKYRAESSEKEDHKELEQIPIDGTGRLIILAEDDEPTRSAVSAMLKASQFEVVTAHNGKDALELLKAGKYQPELVISDVVMPQMGGVELYEKIKENWPLVKTLFITGHPLEGKAQKLMSQGEISWLQKPFSVQQLREAIRNILDDM